MTPTTPSGLYSTVAAWLAISRPGETFEGPSTFLACLAAHATWSMARAISSCASAIGLPVSLRDTAASCAMRRVMTLRHVRRISARSSKDRAPHHSASSRPRATAASTSASDATGWTPTTSPLAGFSDSNVSTPSSGGDAEVTGGCRTGLIRAGVIGTP